MDTERRRPSASVICTQGLIKAYTIRVKRQLVILLILNIISPVGSVAQGILNDNAKIVLTTGSKLVLSGTSGNYTAANGGILSNQSSGGQFTVSGNWINNSTTNGVANNGMSFLFNGTNQTIGGSDTTSFYNLTLQNTSVTVSSPAIFIGNSLTFNKGIIYTTAGQTLEFSNAATVSGASDSGYVEGAVAKTGNQAFLFPTGKSGLYRPIAISAPPVVTDRFVARYYSDDPNQYYDVTSHDPSIDHVSRCEYWTLNRTNGSSSVYVTLTWTTVNCGVSIPADLEVGQWDGTNLLWKDFGNGGTTGNASNGSVISASPLSSFGSFTLVSTSSSNPLPIELICFSAVLNNQQVDLDWSTATEINNDYFTIERTVDNKLFDAIRMIKGSGNTTSTKRYSLTDYNPLEGVSYYRLRQTDYDGKSTVSEQKRVDFKKGFKEAVQIFPNPATSENLQVQINGKEGQILFITIADALGVIVHSGYVYPDSQQALFRLTGTSGEQLPAGIYVITVSGKYGSDNNLAIIK